MCDEALNNIRFSRGQKLTRVRSIIGLLISISVQFRPFNQVCRSKNDPKSAICKVPKGQLLDTLLSYQVVQVSVQCMCGGPAIDSSRKVGRAVLVLTVRQLRSRYIAAVTREA